MTAGVALLQRAAGERSASRSTAPPGGDTQMNTLIFRLGRLFIAIVQTLPLSLVARLGRAGGGLVFCLSARYRRWKD